MEPKRVKFATEDDDAQKLAESEFSRPQDELHAAQETGPKAFGKKYWKTITAAIVLVVVGIFFLIFGCFELSKDVTRAIAFLIVGALCAIPGAYQCYVLFRACKKQQGYQFSQIPSGDDF